MTLIANPHAVSAGDDRVQRRATVALGTFERVVGQRIELDATGRGRSVILGVRHRRPASYVVGLAVGRELERRGVPTVVGSLGARSDRR